MLRLIDEILNGYSLGNYTNIVDGVDLWINPLANPDGAYAGGNQDVWSATRYNANWVDLNRNYPDPEDGPHPDGNSYQTETNLFLGLSDSINFSISANMHGGAEVVNYPWDTWSNLTADNNWWEYVSQEYADSCQANSGNGYFEWSDWNNPFANGVVNGYDWYTVNGGRQDYMNYFKHCREFTLELSDDKTPSPNDLPSLWNANYPSLLNYMEQALFGARGIVTDSITGNPLKAKIEITSHDIDSSQVFSHLPNGDYHRYLFQGSYSVTYSAEGYISKTIPSVSIANNETTVLDVQLMKNNVYIKENLAHNLQLFPQPASSYITVNNLPKTISSVYILDVLGKRVRNYKSVNTQTIKIHKENLNSGSYFLVFVVDGIEYKKDFIFR
jgi:hypothetical protein